MNSYSSLYLKSPQCIMALMLVMTLCLLVYAALEYRIRERLQTEGQIFPHQTGKPANRQTGKPANRQTGKPANRQTGKPANRCKTPRRAGCSSILSVSICSFWLTAGAGPQSQ